jgi:hypothetical protein
VYNINVNRPFVKLWFRNHYTQCTQTHIIKQLLVWWYEYKLKSSYIVTILQLVELLNGPGKWTREDLIHVIRCTLVFVL